MLFAVIVENVADRPAAHVHEQLNPALSPPDLNLLAAFRAG